jgi:hypothetical protein
MLLASVVSLIVSMFILYLLESSGKRYRIRCVWSEGRNQNFKHWYVERTRFGFWWTNPLGGEYDIGSFDKLLDATKYYEDCVRGTSHSEVVFPHVEAGIDRANMFVTEREAALAAHTGEPNSPSDVFCGANLVPGEAE